MSAWNSNHIQLNHIWTVADFILLFSHTPIHAFACEKYRANCKHDITKWSICRINLCYCISCQLNRKFSRIQLEDVKFIEKNFALVEQFISIRLITVCSSIEMNEWMNEWIKLMHKFVELIQFIWVLKTIKQTDLNWWILRSTNSISLTLSIKCECIAFIWANEYRYE